MGTQEPAIATSSPFKAHDIQLDQVKPSLLEALPQPSRLPAADLSDPLEPNCSSDPAEGDMNFLSSPVLYPASSSPAPLPQTKKRKLFQSFPTAPPLKKTKTVGGFEVDEDDEPESKPNAIFTKELDFSFFDKPIAVADIDDLNIPNGHPSSSQNHSLPPLPQPTLRRRPTKPLSLSTSSGQTINIPLRSKSNTETYEQLIASRSLAKEGRAKKSYYGISIHALIEDARLQRQIDDSQAELRRQKAAEEPPRPADGDSHASAKSNTHQMWTEKYRARKFTELVGDERTHRQVLKWLRAWDEVVFPGTRRQKGKTVHSDNPEYSHRNILLLTGPPGLGKTTLAHVCARQAGYEPLEINASDDRSRDVVTGRIKDALGTENVRGIKTGEGRKAGRPVCVVVDEVDGVTTGSGAGGEGGFMKALIDLVQLDARNAKGGSTGLNGMKTKKKGEKFRMLRPLILVCNDVYAPSLRPLRTSMLAEIVHVRKPALDKVMTRLKNVFDLERIPADNDAVRRICESSWGMGTRKQNSSGARGAGEGDIRGILVQAEWIAHKFRAGEGKGRVTKKWVEEHLEGSQASGNQKGMGRGGVREVVERVFTEGAGMPNLPTKLSADDARMVAESKTTALGVADLRKRAAITSLREMVDMLGEHDRLMTDCFAAYPLQVYQDDVKLTKPNMGYDWLHFHDCLSSRIYGGQEWELNPYLSTGACGFHHLFAAVDKGDKQWSDEKKEEEEGDVHPYAGVKADFAAYEAEKANWTLLTELQASFAGPLLRMFSSVDNIATELIPNVSKMLAPDVKPVVVGGSGSTASVASVRKESERTCVGNAVRVMGALDVRFEKVKVEVEGGGMHAKGGFAYRMEPPLDTLTAFHMEKGTTAAAPVRYAVRQVLDQELRKEKLLQASMARHARSSALVGHEDADANKENEDAKISKIKQIQAQPTKVKRDFFGRVVHEVMSTSVGIGAKKEQVKQSEEGRVWVSFHEGFSNAVRKPITLRELMDGF